MAHKKAGGSKASQGSKPAGKRRGVKKYAGQTVTTGQIIARQKGSKLHPGDGVGMGRDFTLFAAQDGTILMRKKQGKILVDVKVNEK